jgi:branched-chain amino acid transport system ATP-binding protein
MTQQPDNGRPSPNGKQPVLQLQDVDTHYGTIQILREVDIEVYPGEIVCLLGGNASGKTTTLKTILGYVEPTHGEVLLDGEVIRREEKKKKGEGCREEWCGKF